MCFFDFLLCAVSPHCGERARWMDYALCCSSRTHLLHFLPREREWPSKIWSLTFHFNFFPYLPDERKRTCPCISIPHDTVHDRFDNYSSIIKMCMIEWIPLECNWIRPLRELKNVQDVHPSESQRLIAQNPNKINIVGDIMRHKSSVYAALGARPKRWIIEFPKLRVMTDITAADLDRFILTAGSQRAPRRACV